MSKDPKSVLSTHQGVTMSATKYSPPNMPSGAGFLMVQAITQNIRYTLDGVTNPTNTVGFQLATNNAPVLIPMLNGTFPQFVQETAGAILQYQWIG